MVVRKTSKPVWNGLELSLVSSYGDCLLEPGLCFYGVIIGCRPKSDQHCSGKCLPTCYCQLRLDTKPMLQPPCGMRPSIASMGEGGLMELKVLRCLKQPIHEVSLIKMGEIQSNASISSSSWIWSHLLVLPLLISISPKHSIFSTVLSSYHSIALFVPSSLPSLLAIDPIVSAYDLAGAWNVFLWP